MPKFTGTKAHSRGIIDDGPEGYSTPYRRGCHSFMNL